MIWYHLLDTITRRYLVRSGKKDMTLTLVAVLQSGRNNNRNVGNVLIAVVLDSIIVLTVILTPIRISGALHEVWQRKHWSVKRCRLDYNLELMMKEVTIGSQL